MADTTALKNRIRAAIKANDNQEITGPVLQQALLDMVDELNGATETEASQRQSGDSTLQQGINTERQARIDADNALGQRITEETQRAQEAEQNLQQGINTEKARANSKELLIKNAFADCFIKSSGVSPSDTQSNKFVNKQGNIQEYQGNYYIKIYNVTPGQRFIANLYSNNSGANSIASYGFFADSALTQKVEHLRYVPSTERANFYPIIVPEGASYLVCNAQSGFAFGTLFSIAFMNEYLQQLINSEKERAEGAFNDLDLIDAAGTLVTKESIDLTLRKNDGSDQDPEWRTLCNLLIPSATTQKAGLMSVAMRNLLYGLRDAGYAFGGIAVTGTNPGIPSGNCFYIVRGAGTYQYFKNADNESIVLENDGIYVFTYESVENNYWEYNTIIGIDSIPNNRSSRLPKSSGVCKSIQLTKQGFTECFIKGSIINPSNTQSNRFVNRAGGITEYQGDYSIKIYSVTPGQRFIAVLYSDNAAGSNIGSYGFFADSALTQKIENLEYVPSSGTVTYYPIVVPEGASYLVCTDKAELNRGRLYNIINLNTLIIDIQSTINFSYVELGIIMDSLGLVNLYNPALQTQETISPHFFYNGEPYSSTAYDNLYNCTDFIPVAGNTQYSLGFVPRASSDSSIKPWGQAGQGVFFYDVDKQYIYGTANSSFITPSNAAYIRFNYRISSPFSLDYLNAHCVLCLGESLPEVYQSYNDSAISSLNRRVTTLETELAYHEQQALEKYAIKRYVEQQEIQSKYGFIDTRGNFVELESEDFIVHEYAVSPLFGAIIKNTLHAGASAMYVFSSESFCSGAKVIGPSVTSSQDIVEMSVPQGMHFLYIGEYRTQQSLKLEELLRNQDFYNEFQSYKPFYSDDLSVYAFKRDGENLYVAYNNNGLETCYWFKKAMANNLYTFYKVGYRNVLRKRPSVDGIAENEGITLINVTSSDNIGPISISSPVSSWVGGNHHYPTEAASPNYLTASCISFDIYADNKLVNNGDEGFCKSIEVIVHNEIYDPAYAPAEGATSLSVKLCDEYVTYQIHKNSIEVGCKHKYADGAEGTIGTYYGMQSMFVQEDYYMTPNGAQKTWQQASSEGGFSKSSYPNFNRFIEKNSTNGYYQSTYLLTDFSLGKHNKIFGYSNIFIKSGVKSYHHLIEDMSIIGGMAVQWSGVYTFFSNPIADDSNVFVYTGVVRGKDTIFINSKQAFSGSIQIPHNLLLNKMSIVENTGFVNENGDTDFNIGGDGLYVSCTGQESMIIEFD